MATERMSVDVGIGPDRAAPKPTGGQGAAKVALLVAATVMAFAFWWWGSGAESRALRAMPSGERQALLSRTLDNLKSVCEAPNDAMREFCRRQAELALEIPECAGNCQILLRERLSRLRSPR